MLSNNNQSNLVAKEKNNILKRAIFVILPALFFFYKTEIYYFFENFPLIVWMLLAIIFSKYVWFFWIKIINLAKERLENLKSFLKNIDSEQSGKLLASKLRRRLLTLWFSLFLLVPTFKYYVPIFLTSFTLINKFLLISIFSLLIMLAFSKKVRILMLCLYSFLAISPYLTVLSSYTLNTNLFTSLEPSLIYSLNLDITNLIDTANKMFCSIAPICIGIMIMIELISFIIRELLKYLFVHLLNIFRLLMPA